MGGMAARSRSARPPVARDAWLRLAACAAAAALLQMDGTIVTVALPSVGRELDEGSHTLAWVLTAYFLAYGLMLFPGGALVDRIGSRRVGIYGLALFAAGSALGALAGSFEVLVASRLVQGAGAGLVSPASLAGAVSGFPPERRGSALGIWGASSGMANLVGPLVGGLLTVAIDWRACWWFFVPASAVVAWALLRFVPRTVHGDESPDAAGLRQRVVAAAALVAALTFVVMIGAFYLAQQYLQVAADYSALGAAAALTLIAVLVGVAAPIAGRLSDERGEGPTAVVGFVLTAIALGLLAIPGVPLDGPGALPVLIPFGLGIGLLFVPASRAALNAVPQAKHGRVSSLLSTCRLLGAALGSVLAGAALSGGVTASHVRIAMLCGAAICVFVGLPAANALATGSRGAARLDFEVADRAAAEAPTAGLNRSRR
jgi:DHA2 family methylenomycin A resistance protein-like MFS transporter